MNEIAGILGYGAGITDGAGIGRRSKVSYVERALNCKAGGRRFDSQRWRTHTQGLKIFEK